MGANPARTLRSWSPLVLVVLSLLGCGAWESTGQVREVFDRTRPILSFQPVAPGWVPAGVQVLNTEVRNADPPHSFSVVLHGEGGTFLYLCQSPDSAVCGKMDEILRVEEWGGLEWRCGVGSVPRACRRHFEAAGVWVTIGASPAVSATDYASFAASLR